MAQDEPVQGFNSSKARLATALLVSDVVAEWAHDYEGEDATFVDIVLDLETDSTGAVRAIRVLSAPGFGPEAGARMEEVIRPLTLPELSEYDGELTFALRREPTEAKELSPVLAGAFAGAVIAGIALVMLSIE